MLKIFCKTRQKVHFLHIGKTGGTAIKSALKKNPETPKYNLELHGHELSLIDIPKGEYAIFFLRDPISRFISGFYSRQRKGQPRYYSEWSSLEKEVFKTFHTPNQLACSLSNKSSKNYPLALEAIKNVPHFKCYDNWYGDLEYFQSRIKDILYIGFQESLNDDFHELKRILGLPEWVQLPDDDIEAHRNPHGQDKSIDEDGIIALNNWYSDDIMFVSLCKKVMSFKRHTPSS